MLVRVLWLLLAALTFTHVLASFPILFAQVTTVCATCVLRLENAAELDALHLSRDAFALYLLGFAALFALVYSVVSALIIWRKSRDPVAILVAFTLVSFGGTAVGGPNDALTNVSPVWAAAVLLLYAAGRGMLLLVFYLFPDGQFAARWIRLPAVAGVGLVIALSLFPFDTLPLWLAMSGIVLSAGVFIGGVLTQIYRYRRRSSMTQRQQTKWIVFGMAVAVSAQIVELVTLQILGFHIWLELLGNLVVSLAFLLIPLAIGVAILRYRLFQIDTLINRTLVYGSLSLGIVALYVLIVGAGSVAFQNGASPILSLVATGAIALLFQPLRAWLQRAANHLLYGQRDEPYTVLRRLGQQLASASAPHEILPAVVETVARALKVPYVGIALVEHGTLTIAAETGIPDSEFVGLPMTQSAARIGELRIAPRAQGETFSAADLRLLEGIAHEAGGAVHALQLSADLRRSHARLITLREEERRRLRRDLHDGLGSALTGVTFKLGAAQNLLQSDTDAVAPLLAELKSDTQVIISDVRRLVYDLRPPALDELGLVSALREHVQRVRVQETQVIVEAPEAAFTLPAAVEIAAYRITLEALANVMRHAQATMCTMRLSLSAEALILQILDDGVGLPANYHAGVGVSAMRERASELGGSFSIVSRPSGGAQVLVQLPLPKE
jgi:signal transduction histidine kinase